MGFSNLQPHEKDAFFSLLDEYFSSRPEIFAQGDGHPHASGSGSGAVTPSTAQGAAVSAVGRAMTSNPEATAKFMSAGLRQVAAGARGAGAGGSGAAGAGASDNDAELTSVAGRIAAFSSSRNNHHAASSSSGGPPPIADKPSAPGLVSVKKFGNSVDMSSASGFLGSLRNKPTSPPAVAVPPAFAPRQNNYGPPPSRRAGTSASTPEPVPSPPPPPPAPRYQPEEEEQEEAGEWADALYDYESGEAGDLKIEEGERVLVVERTSDDWWTGEVNGKKGLFPASYVKVL